MKKITLEDFMLESWTTEVDEAEKRRILGGIDGSDQISTECTQGMSCCHCSDKKAKNCDEFEY